MNEKKRKQAPTSTSTSYKKHTTPHTNTHTYICTAPFLFFCIIAGWHAIIENQQQEQQQHERQAMATSTTTNKYINLLYVWKRRDMNTQYILQRQQREELQQRQCQFHTIRNSSDICSADIRGHASNLQDIRAEV